MLPRATPDYSLRGVVHIDVDAICAVRTLQYVFLSAFAAEEKRRPVALVSHWMLHGVMFDSNAALDLVRIAPDQLSALRPHLPDVALKASSIADSLMGRRPPRLSPTADASRAKTFHPDKLSWVVSVSEAVEIASYVHRAAHLLLTHQPPDPGRPQMFQVLWQAHPGPAAMQHRLEAHALYIIITGELYDEPSSFSSRPMLRGQLAASLYLQQEGMVPAEWHGWPVDMMQIKDAALDAWNEHVSNIQTEKKGTFLAYTCQKIGSMFESTDVDLQQQVVDLTLRISRALLNDANAMVTALD